MNFDFSDDQKFLKAEVRRFLAAACPPGRVRAALDRPASGHDAELWASVSEQGWVAATIPESYGGVGFGRIELCAIAEELGRACAPIPFSSTVYCVVEALLIAGSDAQKETWLPQFASGKAIGALAIADARRSDDGVAVRFENGLVSGRATPVIDGGCATVAIVHAADDAGSSLYIVPLGREVGRRALATLDPSRGVAELSFDGAPAERLGGAGDGVGLRGRILQRAAVYLAFEQLGNADRCLELARDFALERYAFGRPVGSTQAIKHKLADVYVRNELARSHCYFGAWAISADTSELPLAAASARVAASDAAWLASKEMIQTFGGIGTTWEADCHLFYRRAQHLALAIGPPLMWKRALADALLNDDAGRIAA